MEHAGCRRARHCILAAALAALALLSGQTCRGIAAEAEAIALFDLELDDRSASGGVIAPDAHDMEYLRQSTEEARQMLAASGRYRVVDTASVADEVAEAGGVAHCNACDAPLALKLGATKSMIGVVTRVSRTEYTIQIVVRDAQDNSILSNAFTGLRMGANYSWPRGVRWLMTNRLLPVAPAE